MPDGVLGDLGHGEQHLERLRLAHLLGNELAREPLPELLGVAAERDRAQLCERRRSRRESTQQLAGILVAVARRPRLAGDDFRMGLPHAFDDPIRSAVRVIRAEHPGRQVGEGAVEDRLIAGP